MGVIGDHAIVGQGIDTPLGPLRYLADPKNWFASGFARCFARGFARGLAVLSFGFLAVLGPASRLFRLVNV